jgi:GT2 family glycosyltransferase
MSATGARPVYVVLANMNGFRDTIECLESVVRSDYAALRIIVLDNGSTDGSVDHIVAWATGSAVPAPPPALPHLSWPPVTKPIGVTQWTRAQLEAGERINWDGAPIALVANGANLGFGGGNNVAIRYAIRADPEAYVLLLNNDTVVARDMVSAMVRAAARANVGAVGATLLQYRAPERVEMLGGATISMWSGFITPIGAGQPRTASRSGVALDYVSGCCMLITPAGLSRVGEIDERFFVYSEDTDWGVRARQAGLDLVFCAEAELWHKGGSTAVQRSPFHDYHTAKSILLFVHKHRPGAVPAALLNAGVRMLGPKLVRRQWRRIGPTLRAIRDFVRETRG